MRYKTIYADPPWLEVGGGQIVRGAQRHYSLMKTKDICDLRLKNLDGWPFLHESPSVRSVSEENAHLYLWTTNNKLLDALEVVKAWGFEYKTMITWAKDRFGLGQYYRGQTEHCIFAGRGVLPYRTREDGKRAQGRTLIQAARGEHSEKPEAMRYWITQVSHPPYLELFARYKVPGWDVWGNEVGVKPDRFVQNEIFSEEDDAPLGKA